MQEVLQGPDLIQQVAKLIAERNGKNVFLLTGHHFESKGRELLEKKIPYTFYLKQGVNVNELESEAAFLAFSQAGADTILAIGGGSVIDLAKSIIYKLAKQDAALPFFIAAPTTAGSGTEATHFAVLYQEGKKLSLVHPRLLPGLVILDPELTITQPAYQAAVSGIDAFCQAVESFWSKNAGTVSREFSAAAIRLWIKYYHAAIRNPGIENCEGMLQAAHLAGKAINLTRTTGPHALSYYLTSNYGIPHGQAVAIFLPLFFLYNQPGKELLDLFRAADPAEAAELVRTWIQEAGLSVTFEGLGIDKKAVLPFLLDEINQERFENNPVAFNREQLTELIVNYC